MRGKRGVEIEIQFSFIYILIAGSLVIMLIAGGMTQYRKSVIEKTNIVSGNHIATFLKTLQRGGESQHTLALAGMGLELDSEENYCSHIRVEGSIFEGESLDFLPVFSPSRITGSMHVESLPAGSPFYAGNIVIASDTDDLYAFQGLDTIYDTSPAANKKSIGTLGEVKAEEARIRFITTLPTGTMDPSVAGMPDESVSMVVIQPGKVSYYSKKDDAFVYQGDAHYQEGSLLMGAIFAESLESYRCQSAKLKKRVLSICDITKRRSVSLTAEAPGSCGDYAYASTLVGQLCDQISSEGPGIGPLQDNLRIINENLRRQGCPTLF